MSDPALGARHQRVQRLRRLLRSRSARRGDEVFVAEGVKVLAAALEAGAPLEAIYYDLESDAEASNEVLERARSRGVRVFALQRGVLARVADATTPQPVLGVVGRIDRPLADVLRDAPPDAPLVVCVDVRDPGNLGAITRSADAAGAAAVVCCEGSADLYNPKTVRASAGALFSVPVVVDVGPADVLEALRGAGYTTLATVARGGEDYATAPLPARVALVFGNEANGLHEALASSLDRLVSIPMTGRAESLNVAMAATVLCFELARRRRGLATPGDAAEPLR